MKMKEDGDEEEEKREGGQRGKAFDGTSPVRMRRARSLKSNLQILSSLNPCTSAELFALAGVAELLSSPAPAFASPFASARPNRCNCRACLRALAASRFSRALGGFTLGTEPGGRPSLRGRPGPRLNGVAGVAGAGMVAAPAAAVSDTNCDCVVRDSYGLMVATEEATDPCAGAWVGLAALAVSTGPSFRGEEGDLLRDLLFGLRGRPSSVGPVDAARLLLSRSIPGLELRDSSASGDVTAPPVSGPSSVVGAVEAAEPLLCVPTVSTEEGDVARHCRRCSGRLLGG